MTIEGSVPETVAQEAMMSHRVFRSDQREYRIEEWDGVNHSGWHPLDDKVLVIMDEHVSQTSGGVIIPEVAHDRQTQASETGTVIALGEAAFVWNDDVTRKWHGRRPVPGDRVYIDRYAGQLLRGLDGRMYRLMSQRCVGAVLEGAEVVTAGEG